MKDLLTQKEVLIPIGLVESPEISLDLALKSPENGILGVRRSAAMLGLAISMSTAGMLFVQHKATATDSVSQRSTLSNVTIPLATPLHPLSKTPSSHITPLLQSDLKPGESIPKLSEAYALSAKGIPSTNLLSSQAVTAKNSRFSSTPTNIQAQNPETIAAVQVSASISPAIAANPTPAVATSLDHLRAARQRLQAGLNDLQAEQAQAAAGMDSQIQANDVSQPLHPTDLATPISTSQETAILPSDRPESSNQAFFPRRESVLIAQQINGQVNKQATSPSSQKPVTLAAATFLENGFDHPIPIPVPTPESSIPQAVAPSRRLSTPQPLEVLPVRSQSATPLPQKFGNNLANPAHESNPPAPSLAAFNQPIPLAVPTPASQRNWVTPNQAPERLPSTPQSLPIQPSDRNIPSTETTTGQTPEQTYQVRPGDTLNSIARRHGLSMAELIRANRITNPNVITVSQNLLIPESSPRSLPAQSPAIAQTPYPVTVSSVASSSVPVTNLSDRAEGTERPTTLHPQAISGVKPDQADTEQYTEKLKADVSSLNTPTYGHPISPIAIPVVQPPAPEAISAVSDGGEMVDSEWQSDRKKLASRDRSPQLPPLSRPSSPMREGQIIGAAPINVQEYNPNLRIPVGQEVTPELPPLSTPDPYLPDAPGQSSGFIWPAKGVLTSGYGWRWGRMHKGIDIAAPIGTPVLAAAPGEVISAGWNSGGYGNLVKILHADGSITVYAHNSRILVQQGQQVAQGEQISAMGSTGFSTGPHLHFEVHPAGKAAVNPIAYLPSKGKNL